MALRWIPLPPGWIAAGLRLYRRTEQAELDLISAGVAFYGFLAVFPAAAALIAIWGIAFDPTMIRTQLEVLKPMVPPEVLRLIEAQVNGLLQNRGNLGWTTAISTALALWSARAGVAALIRGLNAVYHRPNRSGAFHQLQALLLTMVLVGLALGAMFFQVVAPLILAALPPLQGDASAWLHRMTLFLGLFLVILSISLAYRLGPTHGPVRPPFFSWGLLVAVGLWALAARGFMLYLASFPAYNRIYGSIGAVVALMIWLYVSAYVVLLGAAVDAEHSRYRATGGLPPDMDPPDMDSPDMDPPDAGGQ